MKDSCLHFKRALRSSLLVLLLSMVGWAKVYAYDFTDVTSTGQTLYFTITNNNEHWVKMVYPGSSNSNPWGMTVQPSGMVFLPAMVYYNGATWYVKSIDNYTFYGCTGITEAIIADGINTVGDYSFYGCTSLATLTIGPTVTSIGDYSFWNCPSLTTVNFNAVNCGDMFTYSSGTNYTYYSVFNSGTLNSGVPAIESLTIGNGVNRIPNFAFSNCQNLTGNLVLPSGLISIGQQAFYHCNSLTGDLTIPNSVTSIGSDAFNGCGGFMGDLTLSEVLGSIGSGAFYGCGGLTGHVVIPSSVTSLGDYSFYDCVNITELTIGSSVGSIGDYSFWNCPSLTTVHFNAVNCGEMFTYGSSTNYNYLSVFNTGTQNSGSTPIDSLTIGSGVNRIPNFAFRNSQNLTGHLVLPNGLIYIGQQAFYNCNNLTGVLTIPNTVTSIGSDAFNGCSGLSGTLSLSNQLVSIASGAFYGCSGLTGHVVIPNSVTSLGDYSFYGCSGITRLTIGTGMGSIGDYSFWNCPSLDTVHFNAVNCGDMFTYGSSTNYVYSSVFNTGTLNSGVPPIEHVTIGSGVNRIPNFAFRNCQNLTGNLVLPNGLIFIGEQSFYNCNGLTGTLTIPNTVTGIGADAFNGCIGFTGLLKLPNQMTSTGSGAFMGCTGFTRLTIGNSMQTIGNSSFSGCYGLTGHVVIPNSVTTVGDNSFYGCTGITELTIGTGVTSIGDYSFWNCPSLTTVHFNAVSCGDMFTYGSGTNYNYYSVFNTGTQNSGATPIDSLTIGNGVNRIPNYAFRNSQNLTGHLVLPNGLIYIGQQAFYNCNNLTGVLTIPNTVTSIGSDAFSGCSGFSGTLSLSNQLGSIASAAFYGCSGLTGHVVIPNSVTSLGDYSFYGCSGITRLTIGTGMGSIGDYSFWNCPSLDTVHFNAVNCGDMFTYGSGTNYNYYSVFNTGTQNSGSTPIKKLTIGNGVNRIPNFAFRNSQDLIGNLVLPNDLIYIGQQSFYNCNSLTGTLTIPNSVTSIGSEAFYGCEGFSGVLTLSNQLGSIGAGAFNGCSGLTGHVVIPNSVTSLGDYSFYGCTNITEITIGEGMGSIGDYSFWNCPSLATVHFNAVNCGDMHTYGSGTNYNYYSVFNTGILNNAPTAIMTLTIGSGVNRIPNYAFRNSPTLLGVSFPQVLTTIGTGAFYDCVNLVSITLLPTTPPSVGNDAFKNVPLTIPVFVPCDLSATYATSSGWNQFANIIELCSNSIVAIAYPSSAGTVTGSGTYAPGQICFLTAIPNEGYYFYQWRKNNGEVVSTNSTYNFTVLESGSYVAIFRELMTFTVQASINPSEGGNVTGAGYYTQGQTCTLTAVPNDGYSFVNWTEDGVPVSTSPNYSFTVTGNRSLVANFSNTPVFYTVRVVANPAHGGTVTGGGSYQQGAICTLTATPNTGYSFAYWWENGSNVSSNASYSFTVTGDREFVANFSPTNATFTEAKQLTAGWNWWCTSIEQTGIDGLAQIETSLGDNGVMIKSRENGFVTNYNGLWLGQLSSINNESTYLIQTNANCFISVTGIEATPALHPITLPTGWSWIGCPIGGAMSVTTAMSNLSPVGNDQLKSRDGFSIYYPGAGWIGSLQTVTPCMGLMFNSHNPNTVTLTYPDTAKEEALKDNITAQNNHWTPAMQNYPDNMSVVAVVEMDDKELQGEQYEIAAFADGECRGSAKLMYIEALDRYMAFLTVFGDESAELSFGLYDSETNKEYRDPSAHLEFTTNATVGGLKDPCVVTLRSVTGLDEWDQSIRVFPNPVEQGQLVNFELPAVENGETQIEIINSLGVAETRCSVSSTSATALKAPAVPGVYTLKISAEGKKACFQKLVVK